MTAFRLRHALLALALVFAAGSTQVAVAAAPAAMGRPHITGITLNLEDGRSYQLSNAQLSDPDGGALFWGDWAVANILAPFQAFTAASGIAPGSALSLWHCPGPSGQRPAFMVATAAGPVYPLDPGGPSGCPDANAIRPAVTAITIHYADGRHLSLNKLSLTDGRSGILVWTERAVASYLIPFYLTHPNLPTRPEDVMRIWNTPVQAPASPAGTTELAAYMVKPMCIPGYAGVD